LTTLVLWLYTVAVTSSTTRAATAAATAATAKGQHSSGFAAKTSNYDAAQIFRLASMLLTSVPSPAPHLNWAPVVRPKHKPDIG
jgi:hypothetical protein